MENIEKRGEIDLPKKLVSTEELKKALDMLSQVNKEIKSMKDSIKHHGAQKKTSPSYCSIEEYRDALNKNDHIEKHIENIKSLIGSLEKEKELIEERIMNSIPKNTWIRVGDMGIHKHMEAWGGNHNVLSIAPWTEDLKPKQDVTFYS